MNTEFFKDNRGKRSSNRVHFFMITIWSMLMSTFILLTGDSDIVTVAGASAGFFTAIMSPAMIYMYSQKKNETKQEGGQQ